MYQHCDKDDTVISLHDCRAEKVSFENGDLTFYFPDGFWVLPSNEENHTEDCIKTDASEASFHLMLDEDDVSIYVYTQKKHGKAIRRKWEVSKLIKEINSGKYQLEFLYQYTAYLQRVVACWLWFDKKPYNKECELWIELTGVTYKWNRLRLDRVM